MHTAKRFNLTTEPWIPVQGNGLASLMDVFQNDHLERLGGNPVQKIAVFKLLCAIGQAAWTPETEDEWRASSLDSFKKQCCAYLKRWEDKFWLYGPNPFLQMPSVANAKVATFAALNPEKASGNTTILTQIQIQSPTTDADKALLLVTLMGFATGGKKVDNSITLSQGYTGKSKSGKPGPSLGARGFLHSFVLADSIASTVWLNVFSKEYLSRKNCYPTGVGTAPWEEMPVGEDCPCTRSLKNSLMGRLIPLCRFCLLAENGLHYTEGLDHDGYQDGRFDPTQSVLRNKNKFQTLWADPDKKPWRSLTALLSFLDNSDARRHVCTQVELGMTRARECFEKVALWSGGVKVTSQAGEQYLTGTDDFVEALFEFRTEDVGQPFFIAFSEFIAYLDKLSKVLFKTISGYCASVGRSPQSPIPAKAVSLFWEIAGQHVQELINACIPGQSSENLRAFFYTTMSQIYDDACPHTTPHQIQAWAQHQPRLKKEKANDPTQQ